MALQIWRMPMKVLVQYQVKQNVITVTVRTQFVIFDNEISFSEVGTYKLVIKEIAGSDSDIEYDTTEYEYTLNVSDTGRGTLMIEYEGGAEDAIFVNKFVGGKGEEIPSNPRTYDDIASSIAILSTSIVGLIAAVIFGKRKAKED